MGRPYQSEIGALERTYAEAFSADTSLLTDFVATVAGRGLLTIGSGGSLVSASLMADLHESSFRVVSRSLTPLEFLERRGLWARSGVALLSARGANKDIISAARHAIVIEPHGLLAICNTLHSKLVRILGQERVLELRPSFGRDGFLATNSLLASSLAILRVYSSFAELPSAPPSLPELLGSSIEAYQRRRSLDVEPLLPVRTVHIVYAGPGKIAAIDLESRLSEAALVNTTVSDIRNFGHGRHLWLARRPDDSCVLFLHGPASRSLVQRTKRLLPGNIRSAAIGVDYDDGRGALQGIISSMLIAAAYGTSQAVDLGRPKVPDFGRAIFSIPIAAEKRARQNLVPTDRKLDAAFATSEQLGRYNTYQEVFIRRLKGTLFKALVMDYDGTCLTSRDRFKMPAIDLELALRPLLKSGVLICFATGRGDSIYTPLKAIIPPNHFGRVLLALHNGTLITDLAGHRLSAYELSASEKIALAEFAAAFSATPFAMFADVRSHRCQHTIMPNVQAQGRWLLRAMIELCESNSLPLAVKSSGHSIDVVPRGVDKTLILKHLKKVHGIDLDVILCIGDQGGLPGNDFLLLDGPHGLSVDRVSASAENCWNISNAGTVGSDALIGYLRSLYPQGQGTFRFRGNVK